MSLFRRRRPTPDRATNPTAIALAAGWNGLRWGTPLADFRALFPLASATDSGWWVTGAGPEAFCGVVMAHTQYSFNRRAEFCLVSFIPDVPQRALLTPAVLGTLGAPDGQAAVWTLGDVVVDVKAAGVLASMTNTSFANR